MNAQLKNTTDRRLLLGILHRDNDLVPRKALLPAEAPESDLQFFNDTQAKLKNNASSATIAGGQTFQDSGVMNVDLIDLATVNNAKGGEDEIKQRTPGR